MKLNAQTLNQVLTTLEDYRLIDQEKSERARARDHRAESRFHEGRSSAFDEAIKVLREGFDLGDEDGKP
jgi:hypothetical protein